MADKTITITIKRKPRPAARPGGKKRGPLKGNRKAEILHRRLTSGLINFYDLGRYKVGSSFVDYEHTIDLSGGFRDINVGDFTARDSELLPLIGSDYKTKFQKLNKANSTNDKYSFYLGFFIDPDTFFDSLNNLTQFTDGKGLDIPDSSIPSLYVGSFNRQCFFECPFSDTALGYPVKFTTVPDHSASGVTPILNKGIDVLVMPWWSAAGDASSYFIQPRSRFLDNDPPLSPVGISVATPGDLDGTTKYLVAVLKTPSGTYYLWSAIASI